MGVNIFTPDEKSQSFSRKQPPQCPLAKIGDVVLLQLVPNANGVEMPNDFIFGVHKLKVRVIHDTGIALKGTFIEYIGAGQTPSGSNLPQVGDTLVFSPENVHAIEVA